jgi:hypothetical protein
MCGAVHKTWGLPERAQTLSMTQNLLFLRLIRSRCIEGTLEAYRRRIGGALEHWRCIEASITFGSRSRSELTHWQYKPIKRH